MTAPQRVIPLLITLALLVFCSLMALYPAETWHASVRGLSIWWDVLFPSLFPFLVLSELLLGFGIVHFLGTLLNPLMRPLFRVPGSGGFVFAVSCASGYPTGAKLTAQLWEQKLVTREEGERLVAFTTSSDPIFMIGAVSVGFFHNTSIAPILVASHYAAAIFVGVLMRFHGRSSPASSAAPVAQGGHRGRFMRAIYAMHNARQADGRAFGELLRQAVASSLRLIIIVGGLVVFFSVIMELLVQTGWLGVLYSLTEQGLQLAGLPPSLSHSLVGGLFEVTLGAKEAGATASSIPLVFKVAAASFVLSWGGLSVHAQIMSVLSSTPMRYAPFLLARALHAAIAPLLVVLLWPLLMGSTASPAFLDHALMPLTTAYSSDWKLIGLTGIRVFSSILVLMLCLAWIGSQLMLKRGKK
ncbi:sporulation integral membrane protein YlbJ [Paenibacillus barcinonensis]|uniref:Sporulation integral membrane protein YlbJ n=1 Tax=Paenibacillus barcinonensis TaxID=198119 RepID=A0A2V4V6K9_PAEBA|nr:sporulation integral membrane protein YlbJ [Paenibacillus barcinonensis]PYE48159.1 sporulation integral membrane protein YlbJ [Paenibacillus barcinonensis]QKS56981.1 sporulation integral membrane protein YlbJ [Paenibacillus barcinonensis]